MIQTILICFPLPFLYSLHEDTWPDRVGGQQMPGIGTVRTGFVSESCTPIIRYAGQTVDCAFRIQAASWPHGEKTGAHGEGKRANGRLGAVPCGLQDAEPARRPHAWSLRNREHGTIEPRGPGRPNLRAASARCIVQVRSYIAPSYEQNKAKRIAESVSNTQHVCLCMLGV